MLHPIFSVLVNKPELAIDHVAGYAALVQEEASSIGGQVMRRAVAWGVAALGALVFLVLAGVAVMVGTLQGQFHWVLVAAPGVPLVAAAIAWNIARQRLPAQAFAELKAQFDADAQALRAIGARS